MSDEDIAIIVEAVRRELRTQPRAVAPDVPHFGQGRGDRAWIGVKETWVMPAVHVDAFLHAFTEELVPALSACTGFSQALVITSRTAGSTTRLQTLAQFSPAADLAAVSERLEADARVRGAMERLTTLVREHTDEYVEGMYLS